MPSHSIWQFVQYILPIVIIIYSAFDRRIRYHKHTLLVIILVLLVGAQSLFYSEAGIANYALSLLTYSSLLLLAMNFHISSGALSKVVRFISAVAIIEFCIGILQFVSANQGLAFARADAGDYFTGTIISSSHLLAAKSLITAIFLYYQKVEKSLLVRLGLILSLLSAVFASFLMGVVIVLGAWVFIELIQLKNQKVSDKIKYTTLLIVLIGIFAYTQSSNLRLILLALESLYQLDISNVVRFQKLTVFLQSIQDIWLSDIKHFFIGTGLGRFSSRSAMILSGGYLNESVQGLVPISRTTETFKYIYTNWNPAIWSEFGGSIMAMPTSSIQAIIIELGLVGVGFLYFIGSVIHKKVKSMDFVPDKTAYILALSFIGLLITDLWLEYPSLMIHLFLLVSIVTISPKDEDSSSSQ